MADTAAPDTSGIPQEEAPVISVPKPKPVPLEPAAPRPSREKKTPVRFEGQEEEEAPESPKPPSAKRKKASDESTSSTTKKPIIKKASDESTSSRTKKPTIKKKEADEPSGDEEEPKKNSAKKVAVKKAVVKEKDTTKYCCGKTYDNKQPYIGCSSEDACKGIPPPPPPHLPSPSCHHLSPKTISLYSVKGVEWFHVKCVGLNEKSAKKLSDWYCEACKEGEEGMGEADFDLVCRHADTKQVKRPNPANSDSPPAGNPNKRSNRPDPLLNSQDGDQGLPGDDLGDDEEEHPMTGGDLLADEDPEEEDVADLV
jgi:hypothetical protein